MLIQNSTQIRVRYAETDQMGVVYNGNYAQYFEIGRVEMLRSMGTTYKMMEASGIMLPVRKLEINFIKPAGYDDLLTIVTSIKVPPTTKLIFEHEIYSEAGLLLTTGLVQLVFVSMDTGRPIKAPAAFLEVLQKFDLEA